MKYNFFERVNGSNWGEGVIQRGGTKPVSNFASMYSGGGLGSAQRWTIPVSILVSKKVFHSASLFTSYTLGLGKYFLISADGRLVYSQK